MTGPVLRYVLAGLLLVGVGVPAVVMPWSFATVFHTVTNDLRRVAASSGLRPEANVNSPPNIPDAFVLGSPPYSTYGALDGMGPYSTTIYGASPPIMAWPTGAGFGLRFKATTKSIRLWQYNHLNPSRLILLQDGKPIADVTPSNASAGMDVVSLATGLSGSHEYEIDPVQVGRPTYIYALMVDRIDAVKHIALPLDVTYGDSLAQETGTSAGLFFDARRGDAYQIAKAAGHASLLVGFGGVGVSTFLRDNTSAATTILPVLPARVFIWAGAADMRAAVELTTFQAAYQQMLANFRTALKRGQKIYCRGIPPEVNWVRERLTYNAAIAAAVEAMGDPNIKYVNTDGWIDPRKGVDTDDGIHPNASGGAKIAARQLHAL